MPAEFDLSGRQLEAYITEPAAHINATTCRLLLLIAEYDRREAWGHGSVKSCAHWLTWKCGLSMGAAREHVRCVRALSGLRRS